MQLAASGIILNDNVEEDAMTGDENTRAFAATLLNENASVGVISGGAFREFEDLVTHIKPDARILKARIPYTPGRKDRLLAGAIMQLLGMPFLDRSVSTDRAWDAIAGATKDQYDMMVIENADLLDRRSLDFANRDSLPTVILVGGDRLKSLAEEKQWFHQQGLFHGGNSQPNGSM
jgi:hypothetical protein